MPTVSARSLSGHAAIRLLSKSLSIALGLQVTQGVSAGPFYNQNFQAYGSFWFEIICRPLGNIHVSGGDPTELSIFGTVGDGFEVTFVQNAADTRRGVINYIFNVANGRQGVVSSAGPYPGEVFHYSAWYDAIAGFLYVWINGVADHKFPIIGPRNMQDFGFHAPQELSLGGGDHPGDDFDCLRLRLIENFEPNLDAGDGFNGLTAYPPDVEFSAGFFDGQNSIRGCNLLWDFSDPRLLVPDLSPIGWDMVDGHNPGVRHTGKLQTVVGAQRNLGFPAGTMRLLPLPDYTDGELGGFPVDPNNIQQPAVPIVATPIPADPVLIWDPFNNRRDQTPFWDRHVADGSGGPSLGSTMGGSRGALAWGTINIQNQAPGQGGFGIINGLAACINPFQIVGMAYVDAGTQDVDIQVNRVTPPCRNFDHVQTGVFMRAGAAAGAAVANNFIHVSVHGLPGSSFVRAGQVIAGVDTVIPGQGGFVDRTAPTDTMWSRLRAVINGNPGTLTLYVGYPTGVDGNGSPTYTWTALGAAIPVSPVSGQGTLCGIIGSGNINTVSFMSGYTRWADFAVRNS